MLQGLAIQARNGYCSSPRIQTVRPMNCEKAIQDRTGKQIGILIIDSHGRAWRNGTVGVAIGLAGLPGLQDLRGQPDLFDFTLRITQVGVADELAAAASLVMGQAAEGTPVVHVRGFPYPLREGSLEGIDPPQRPGSFPLDNGHMNQSFWQTMTELAETGSIVLDRPKGSAHPRYPEMIYPLDYGYLENTSAAMAAASMCGSVSMRCKKH